MYEISTNQFKMYKVPTVLRYCKMLGIGSRTSRKKKNVLKSFVEPNNRTVRTVYSYVLYRILPAHEEVIVHIQYYSSYTVQVVQCIPAYCSMLSLLPLFETHCLFICPPLFDISVCF